jgi:DNA repair photolyase
VSIKVAKGNMYEFVTHVWNPIKGRCSHNCSYCYVKRIAHRFGTEQNPIRFDEKEMRTDLGSGNFIFVGSSCDIFAPDIPDNWIRDIVEYTRTFTNNQYLLQTKNPNRIISSYPGTSTGLHKICTTIETNRWVPEVMRNALPTKLRAFALAVLTGMGYRTMVTVEPIMDFDLNNMVRLLRLTKAEQVNIGADSGRNNLPEPPAEKIEELVAGLIEAGINVKLKKNLKRLMPGYEFNFQKKEVKR